MNRLIPGQVWVQRSLSQEGSCADLDSLGHGTSKSWPTCPSIKFDHQEFIKAILDKLAIAYRPMERLWLAGEIEDWKLRLISGDLAVAKLHAAVKDPIKATFQKSKNYLTTTSRALLLLQGRTNSFTDAKIREGRFAPLFILAMDLAKS